jgi:hypothetical protein
MLWHFYAELHIIVFQSIVSTSLPRLSVFREKALTWPSKFMFARL